MSVLVDALTLVVPRRVLDASYPGGAGAFLSTMRARGSRARLAVADAFLVAVSFHMADDATKAAATLLELGLVGVDDDLFGDPAFHDFAFVDQHDGPTAPCPWLEWRRHEEGYSLAWLEGEEPGVLAVPAWWTPGRSRALTRTDVRGEPGRMMRLAAEGDVETWLDFRTGQLITGAAERVAPVSSRENPMDDRTVPLIDIVVAAVEANGWSYTRPSAAAIVFPITGDHAAYDGLVVTGESIQIVTVYCSIGARIPLGRRGAVAEAIARANFGLPVGGFELDFSDGELRYKVGIDVGGSALTPEMARDMIGLSVYMCDRYHDALMRVAYGAEEPAAAIEQAEEA